MAYKVLASGIKGSGYTTNPSYTVPTGKSAVVSKVIIYCVSIGGGTDGAAAVYIDGPTLPDGAVTIYLPHLAAGESFEATGGITLAAGQSINILLDSESVGATMHAVVCGDES